MTTGGWIAAVSWAVCTVAVWRPAFRRMWGDMPLDDWDVLWPAVFATTVIVIMGAPLIAALIAADVLLRATVTPRADAGSVAKALRGTPRAERQAKRIRDLQQRNGELERELGLR